ncbi:hypothetical protein LXL04_017844 [Taraxacum kok-saghyz]
MAQASEKTSNVQSGQQVQKDKNNKSTSKDQTSPTFQQLLQREGSKWSQISTEKLKKNGGHPIKKSVLEKVKDKAKKLKHSLSIKKHHHENDPPSTTSVTCVSSTGSKEKGHEHVEVHGARISESKNVPTTSKQDAKNHPREAPATNHSTSKDDAACSSNYTIKDDADSKNQTPSIVADHTDTINQAATTSDVSKQDNLTENNSRFSNLTVSTSRNGERSIEGEENMNGESRRREKGVSVKEYLMHKFEPGEDERALSQIITQTISPRRDKVREAMSSFLKHDESSSKSEVNSSDVDNDTNPNLKSKSLPASVNATGLKIGTIVASHSLGSNASKNLNQTFKETVASYQNNINNSMSSSSANKNAGLKLNEGSSRSPASRSPLEVVEEENDGRIVQGK